VVCGSNLAGVGKAILLYGNEYGGDFPRAGGANSTWSPDGSINDWTDQTGNQYGQTPCAVTITSSLFLLIKYEDVTPGQFVCKGDAGTREFKLSDATVALPTEVDDVTDAWDFGSGSGYTTSAWPGQYNSYAYHCPYDNTGINPNVAYALRSDSNPSSPVCADRNPYWDKNATSYLNGSSCQGAADEVAPSCTTTTGYKDDDKTGNAAAHSRDGQNILFIDTHVKFEKFPNVGVAKDNIWKTWLSQTPPATNCDRETGQQPPCGNKADADLPAGYSEVDAFLVSETNNR
jgi:hypothetical protein